MNKRLLIALIGTLLTGSLIAVYWSTQDKDLSSYQQFDPRFEGIVAAYPQGELSRKDPIKVRFAHNMVPPSQLGQALSVSPFNFEPSIEGKAYWEDVRTLVFTPAKALNSAEQFLVDLQLKEWLPEQHDFKFSFHTRPQDLHLELTRSRPLSQTHHQISGVVRTLDFVPDEEVEKTLQARYAKQNLRIRWDHAGDELSHHFTIDSLARKEEDQSLLLNWNGKPLGISLSGEKSIPIPATRSFRHLHTYAYSSPDPYVVLEFSQPLDREQDLSGLIDLEQTEERYLIEENRVKIYPQTHLSGPIKLQLSPGIRDQEGVELLAYLEEELTFSEAKPEVRILGHGSILPKGKTMPLVFESIGLRAIDVRVIKIFENNIPRFLQDNRIDGHAQLKRVGQPVAEKKIELNGNSDLDLNQWNRHSLDLASLIEADPGAIYEVAIGFRPQYSLFDCASLQEGSEEVNMVALENNWYEYTGNFYERYRYYRWSERDDPCKIAYYNTDRIVKRNILASDLGLIAKIGDNGATMVVTNLQTTEPMAGVELEFYDLQLQLMNKARTDGQGFATTEFERPPFLAVAKQGKQRAYLRLDDGTALSMSRFDTQGQQYHKGVKGFIYGERGVWRPGDPIYLNFILQDEGQILPENHPVNFELIDPRGQVVVERVLNQGTNGFYPFHIQTDADAPTGNYTAKVQVGGASFSKTIKVETIMPNRMKLALEFPSEVLTPSGGQTGILSAQWLHGAIARNLKADVRVSLRSTTTQFKGYPNYQFDDPVRKLEADEQTIFEGRLDETGEASIQPNIEIDRQAPGMLKANFVTKVYEPGGAFSVDRFSMDYAPYTQFVGVRAPEAEDWRSGLEADRDHLVEIATVNAEGKPVSSQVEITIYRLNWRWWWDQSQDNIGNYRGEINADQISSTTINTVNGKARYTLNIKKPQWGRFLIRAVDEQGHASGQIVYVTWPGWNRNLNQGQEGAQMLSFSADKETYEVGETVSLDIPTGNAGRALVSLENGSQVLKTYWVDAQVGSTRFEFEATEEMTPNIYVHISLLQPHAQTANDLPIRMYGVIPLRVENSATHLKPKISMAETIRPNTRYQVKVSEATGQPMTYTLAVVDEGLLGLTRYSAPDPWQTFYQREALNVKTWDIYNEVLGAYGGEVKSLLSIGGGADQEGPKGKKADRFRPVVEFLGPFELKAGQTVSHALDMPNYIGEVRAMVIAGAPERGAYGVAEQSAKVKQPLMVLGTLPRVLGPGETVKLPVTIFALEDNLGAVNVELEVGSKLLVEGRSKKVARFYEAGEQMEYFEVGVLSSVGKTPVKIIVSSGSERATYETDIEIRNPNPRVTTVYDQALEAGKDWSQSYRPVGMRGTNNGVLEVSAIPPINLGRRLDYLIRYPYGCIEQTTSSGFPQVYLSKLMDLGPQRKRKIEGNIRATLDRLRRFQVSSGGFAYWPGNSDASEWGSNYAGHFMLEAQASGFRIPGDMLKNWRNFQRKLALAYSPRSGTYEGQRDEMYQAYRLYLLAMAGKPEIGAMNRFRRRKGAKPVPQWLLAGAYHLAGRKDVARKIAQDLGTQVREYNELGGTYGSTLRDKAIILMVLSVMEDRTRAKDLVQYVSDRLSQDAWYSTQTTAYSLVAMAKFVGQGGASKDMNFEYRLGNGSWQKVSVGSPIWQADIDVGKAGKLEFRNRNRAILFPRLILDGIPLQGDTTSASNGLQLSIEYFDLNGKKVNEARLEQGSDFMAKVIIQNTRSRPYEELAIDQIFPSGWEVINTRLDGSNLQGDTPEYRDIRDDRVYTFFDLRPNEKKTFFVRLNATYLGKYYLPTVTASAMYDRTINARRPGRWVQVFAPGAD